MVSLTSSEHSTRFDSHLLSQLNELNQENMLPNDQLITFPNATNSILSSSSSSSTTNQCNSSYTYTNHQNATNAHLEQDSLANGSANTAHSEYYSNPINNQKITSNTNINNKTNPLLVVQHSHSSNQTNSATNRLKQKLSQANNVALCNDENENQANMLLNEHQHKLLQKDREERLRLVREKREQELEKRKREIEENLKRKQELRDKQIKERLERIAELKHRENEKRAAVEERRRQHEEMNRVRGRHIIRAVENFYSIYFLKATTK
jgi:hypothetical protein